MAEHKADVRLALGIPPIHGLEARLEAGYEAQWRSRERALVDRTAEIAGLDVQELGELLANDERLRDLVSSALNRARDIADDPYREAIARLVATGLDDAKVDVAAYVLEELKMLQPVHLRLALFAWTFYRTPGLPPDEDEVSPNEAEYFSHHPFDLDMAAVVLGIDSLFATVMLNTLVGGDYLQPTAGHFVPGPKNELLITTLFPNLARGAQQPVL